MYMQAASKSTNRHDYEQAESPLGVMPKDYPDGFVVGWHAHVRGQLIHAVSGLMKVRTEQGFWLVPPLHALWMPPGLLHDMQACGPVALRTLYIHPEVLSQLPEVPKALGISPLLRELLVRASATFAPQTSFSRHDEAFDADGVQLRGWLYLPTGSGPARRTPAVVMAGGYGTTKEMFTDRYAEAFATAGLAVLLYDHRGFGASGGEPRQEIDPWRQVEDLRHAITYASSLPAVDPARIGVWGSSYSGGHALVVAATDRRVRCVAVQVPTTHGSQTAQRRASGEAEAALLLRFAEERLRRARGEAPARLRLMGDANSNAIYRSQEAVDWYTAAYARAPGAVPEVTLRSVEAARGYNPVDFIDRVSPTALLMQVAEHDRVTPTDLALSAYARALEPKALRIVPGAGHFDVYERDFDSTSQAAINWFQRYLGVRRSAYTAM